MSIGLTLLRSIIESGSRSFIRNLQPELFVQEERPAFDYFVGYYRQYGGIPSLQTMQENGFALPPAAQPPAYLLDRVVNRAILNTIRADIGDFQSALTRQQGDQLRDLLSRMSSAAGRYAAVNDVFALPDAAEMAMQEYARTVASGGAMTGVTFGIDRLDELTNGAMPGEVVTWVARPNMGKSYLLAKAALAAHRQDRKILLVSMEMGAVSMARRLIGLRTGINPDHIKRGQLSMWGIDMVLETIRTARGEPDFMLVSGNLTKSAGTVDALIQEYTPDEVLIDAQYLMQPSDKRGAMKKFELLDKVGVEIQQIALARNLPIHQSVQYNREQGKGTPDLRNIGGTDTVGQISSIVVSVMEGEEGYETTRRRLEIIKNREGALGGVTINFLFNPLDFSEIPEEQQQGGAVDTGWMV